MKKTHRFQSEDLIFVHIAAVREANIDFSTGGASSRYRFLSCLDSVYVQAIVVRPYGRSIVGDPYNYISPFNQQSQFTYVDDYIVLLGGEHVGRIGAVTDQPGNIISPDEWEETEQNLLALLA